MNKTGATFYSAWREKKRRNFCLTGAGISGSGASRVEEFLAGVGEE